MKKILLFIAIIFYSSLSMSGEQGCEVEKTTHIYFGNGIQNSLIQAISSRNSNSNCTSKTYPI